MPLIEFAKHFLMFLLGLAIVILTLFSAVSTFVLPRASRSRLNVVIFRAFRKVIELILHFTRTYRQRDAIMAYYAPISLMSLVPTWYLLISLGYTGMYWALGAGDLATSFRLSGSSLFTLGFATPENMSAAALVFTEAMLGLILVALLIAYLPTMYAAFSRREQAVSMMEVRAGNPPSAAEMLQRFHRNQGLEKLGDYWKSWEIWFADLEETHTTLPALVFFRSPRGDNSWITAAGAVLDTAAITLSAVDIPYETSAALSMRAGFFALRRIANYFVLPNPQEPHYPVDPISIGKDEFLSVMNQLASAGLPIKPDLEKAWIDYAGWRVNYDRSLILLCDLVWAPWALWSSDRLDHTH